MQVLMRSHVGRSTGFFWKEEIGQLRRLSRHRMDTNMEIKSKMLTIDRTYTWNSEDKDQRHSEAKEHQGNFSRVKSLKGHQVIHRLLFFHWKDSEVKKIGHLQV